MKSISKDAKKFGYHVLHSMLMTVRMSVQNLKSELFQTRGKR